MIRNLFLAGVAVMGLAGCGQSAPSRPACPPGKVCLQYGNTSEPQTLDPHLSTGTWEDRIQSDILVGLTQSDPAGKPIPGMATSWDISPDGLVWTFHLRDAKWSDGVPVTADDFVFSFRRLLDPKTASEYASVFFLVKGAQGVGEGIDPARAGEMVPKFWDEGLLIVRAGGEAGLFSAILAGWTGGRFRDQSQPVTREILE